MKTKKPKAKSARRKSKHKGVTHHHITRVMYVSLVAFIVATGLILGIYSSIPKAEAAIFTPYGGWVSSVPLPNPTALLGGIPNPVCPVYYMVTNTDPTSGLPPVFGIFIPPIAPGATYDYNNFFVPGTPILGGLISELPCVGGLTPFPIYPLYRDGLFYLTGTGGFGF